MGIVRFYNNTFEKGFIELTEDRNAVSNNSFNGTIVSIHSSKNTISNNNFSKGGMYIYQKRNNNVISNNVFTNTQISISGESNNNTITNNTLTDSDVSIRGTSNTVSDNYFSNSGISIYEGTNNTIAHNTFYNYDSSAIYIYSPNNTISDNILTNTGAFVSVGNNNFQNNTVNGKPLMYLEKLKDITIGDAGQIIAVDCENITTRNLEISNTSVAIEFLNTTKSLIEGNSIHNNEYGIYFLSSPENIIRSNVIYDDELGMFLDSNSNNNTIYNNLFNNTRNVAISSTNIWSVAKTYAMNIIGGSYLGGNAWLTPYKTGFSQLAPDSDGDGICDYPYQIDQNNVDLLPLKVPGNLSNPPIQTILELESTSSPPNSTSTLVSLKISSNEIIAGINLTVVYNPNVVELIEIRSDSTIYSSIDNSNGVAKILLTNTSGINAIQQATLLTLKFKTKHSNTFTYLNITDVELSNNYGNVFQPDILLNGSITVTIRGDFNGNERVDIGDVVKIAYMVIGMSDEDLAADFNGDGEVDIADLAKIAYYVLGEINEL